jgi:hypothetical protein
LKLMAKVCSDRDAVDVKENGLLTVLRAKTVIYAASNGGRIGAPV